MEILLDDNVFEFCFFLKKFFFLIGGCGDNEEIEFLNFDLEMEDE